MRIFPKCYQRDTKCTEYNLSQGAFQDPFNTLLGCPFHVEIFIFIMRKYRLVAKKGEGTFSEVLKAQNVKDGRYHAIKCMKNRFDSIDQVINNRN